MIEFINGSHEHVVCHDVQHVLICISCNALVLKYFEIFPFFELEEDNFGNKPGQGRLQRLGQRFRINLYNAFLRTSYF